MRGGMAVVAIVPIELSCHGGSDDLCAAYMCSNCVYIRFSTSLYLHQLIQRCLKLYGLHETFYERLEVLDKFGLALSNVDVSAVNKGEDITVDGYVDMPDRGKTAMGVESSWPQISAASISDQGAPKTP